MRRPHLPEPNPNSKAQRLKYEARKARPIVIIGCETCGATRVQLRNVNGHKLCVSCAGAGQK